MAGKYGSGSAFSPPSFGGFGHLALGFLGRSVCAALGPLAFSRIGELAPSFFGLGLPFILTPEAA